MSKKKILKITLIVLGFLLILFFGLSSYIHRHIDHLVKENITEALGEGYSADYRRSNIGFSNNTITLKNLEISKENDTLIFWNSHIAELKVHGFQAFKFLRGGGVTIDSIIVDEPEIKLFVLDRDTSQVALEPDSINPKTHIELAISAIQINNGAFEFNREGPEVLDFDFNFRVTDISLLELLNGEPLDFLDNLDLSLENINYQFPDSVYRIMAHSLIAKNNDNTVKITEFDFHSNLTGTDYPEYYGWQKANIGLQIPEISLERPLYIEKDSLVFPRIIIDGINADFVKDKNYPLPNRHTELPQNGMARMGLKFRCDSLLIKEGNIKFEATQTTGDVASIEVTQINGTILAMQNIDSLLPAFTIIAEAKLEDEANLNVKSVYKYGPLDPFTLEGSLGNTNLAFMDDFLMKMIGIKIEEGSLSKLNFEMTGNTYGVNGFVDFFYDHLVIHAVDKETGEDKKMVNFMSNVVGGWVFWQENPSKDQFRRGSFNVERDARKGFVSQWTDGLLYGIMNTVSKVDPRKVQNTSKSLKGKFSKKK